MAIEQTANNDSISVMVDGDIEINSLVEFKKTIGKIINGADKNIDIDIAKVGHIDFSGMGVLLHLHTLQNKKGRRLTIRNANAEILTLLRLTTLNDIFGL
jgi:anti-sigma B factor antagonist